MWDSLNQEAVARLPRQAHSSWNGWEKCFAKLEEFRTYGDDWDGQGAAFGKPAATITCALIDGAVFLARKLQLLGVSPPDGVIPTVLGGVVLDWLAANGDQTELEISEPESAEILIFNEGRPLECLPLNEPVMA